MSDLVGQLKATALPVEGCIECEAKWRHVRDCYYLWYKAPTDRAAQAFTEAALEEYTTHRATHSAGDAEPDAETAAQYTAE